MRELSPLAPERKGVHRSAAFASWPGTLDFLLPRWEPQRPGSPAGTAHRELVYTDGSLLSHLCVSAKLCAQAKQELNCSKLTLSVPSQFLC